MRGAGDDQEPSASLTVAAGGGETAISGERADPQMVQLFWGRGFKRSQAGRRLDPVRTARSFRLYKGRLHYKRPIRTLGPVVVLWDVSASMAESTARYEGWLRHLAARHRRLRVFAFSTRHAEVTDYLRGASGAPPATFGQGTNIAQVMMWLAQSEELLSPQTALVVVSDGWEAGDPELLEEGLRRIRPRVGWFLWLNPYADDPRFAPTTRAMTLAARFSDRIASGFSTRL